MFEKFRKSLGETRQYYDHAFFKFDIEREAPHGLKPYKIKKVNILHVTIEGTHDMNPGNPDGVKEAEEFFRVKLPRDIHKFYKEWDGGFLFLSGSYRLLSVKQMIEGNSDLRIRRGGDLKDPWDILRIIHIADGNYLGYEKATDGKLYMNEFSIEYSDEYLLSDVRTRKCWPNGTPRTFTGVLNLLLDNEGKFFDNWSAQYRRLK